MREFSGTWMRHSGDLWGGVAAMLVALPAAVAFGVTVYSAIGPQYAAFGALAGILGATALGLIAPTFGGTDRLISALCAPAAAVLSAFAIELVAQGVQPVVQRQYDGIGAVTDVREPFGATDYRIEHVAVQHPQPSAVGGNVDGLGDDFDVGHRPPAITPEEFVVMPGI